LDSSWITVSPGHEADFLIAHRPMNPWPAQFASASSSSVSPLVTLNPDFAVAFIDASTSSNGVPVTPVAITPS
jgi:hypothetical protein